MAEAIREAIKGVDQILLFRELGKTEKATKLMFQTEHSVERSLDGGDSVATKDGSISSPGTAEIELPFSSIMARGDECYEMLLDCFENNKTVEVWAIDKGAEPKGSGEVTKYPAKYMQGKLTDFSETANAEDMMELEGTISVNGIPQSGDATLSVEQAKVVQYAFKDTTAEDVGAEA